jgi:hypothetical protein
MTERINHPGPGRSTSEAALNEIKKKIAERNEQAHQAERKRREPRERMLAEKRRQEARY